jgi:hypothetical protein
MNDTPVTGRTFAGRRLGMSATAVVFAVLAAMSAVPSKPVAASNSSAPAAAGDFYGSLELRAPPLSAFERRVLRGLRSSVPGATIKRWARQHKFRPVSSTVSALLQKEALDNAEFAQIRAAGVPQDGGAPQERALLLALVELTATTELLTDLEWWLWNSIATVTADKHDRAFLSRVILETGCMNRLHDLTSKVIYSEGHSYTTAEFFLKEAAKESLATTLGVLMLGGADVNTPVHGDDGAAAHLVRFSLAAWYRHLDHHRMPCTPQNDPVSDPASSVRLAALHPRLMLQLTVIKDGRPSALTTAVIMRNWDAVAALLLMSSGARGVDANAIDKVRRSALHYAADVSDIHIWGEKLLTEHGNILHDHASGDCVVDAVDEFRMQGDSVLREPGLPGRTYNATRLRGEVDEWNLAFVKVLLKAGADPNMADATGQTPLHIAAQTGNHAAATALMAAGGDALLPDAAGRTPMQLASFGGFQALAEDLAGTSEPPPPPVFSRTAVGGGDGQMGGWEGAAAEAGSSAAPAVPGSASCMEWLQIVHPDVVVYAQAMTEYGYDDVVMLQMEEPEAFRKALGEIGVKEPHSSWLINAQAALHTPTSSQPPVRSHQRADKPRELERLCDFDVRTLSDLSEETFQVQYVAVHRPLLIRRGLSDALPAGVLHEWTRSRLTQALGNFPLQVARTVSGQRSQTLMQTLGEFLGGLDMAAARNTTRNSASDMVVESRWNGSPALHALAMQVLESSPAGWLTASSGDTSSSSSASAAAAGAAAAAAIAAGESPASAAAAGAAAAAAASAGRRALTGQLSNYQVNIGGALAGTSLHYHHSTMSTLVFGRKRWTLLPPAHAFYSTKHFADDFTGLRQEQHALECVQQSGDILFLPSLWAHGVMYERTSVGVSFLNKGGALAFHARL